MLSVDDEVRAQWDASTPEKRKLAHWEPEAGYVEQLGSFVEGVPFNATWLDWGSGGGALLWVARSYSAESVLCVDVSRASLNALPPHGGMGIGMLLPDQTHMLPDASIDVVCSFSCFQHFPSRAYGLEVLREMRRLAKPGALGFIQTRYYEPGDAYDPARSEGVPYAQRYLRSCAYQVGEFWTELERAGFKPQNVELEPYRQYAWYRFGG